MFLTIMDEVMVVLPKAATFMNARKSKMFTGKKEPSDEESSSPASATVKAIAEPEAPARSQSADGQVPLSTNNADVPGNNEQDLAGEKLPDQPTAAENPAEGD